jgi:hypothetical protein
LARSASSWATGKSAPPTLFGGEPPHHRSAS